MANLAGAAKTRHYEMATYASFVQIAKELGEQEAGQLVEENLDQENTMAKRVQGLANEMGEQMKAEPAGTRIAR